MTIGLAIGISLSGQIIDRFGAEKGFYISIISGLSAFFITLAFRKKLEQKI